MKTEGNIQKLKTNLCDPVEYQLPIGEELLPLNPYLGKTLTLEFTGVINCVSCGRKTNKSFSQGHCFPCFRSLASCDTCIMKPELCHYAQGTCREPQWGESHCMIPHYVYLSNTSGLKVGITRHSQVPTRWIDQGAIQAVPLFQVEQRFHSGLVEDTLRQYVADKTNWRAMLKGSGNSVDLLAERDRLLEQAADDLAQLKAQHPTIKMDVLDEDVVEISYPVLEYPEKVSSFNFDKNPIVSGTLMGIKGQYLIFDNGVINIRKFGGYKLRI